MCILKWPICVRGRLTAGEVRNAGLGRGRARQLGTNSTLAQQRLAAGQANLRDSHPDQTRAMRR